MHMIELLNLPILNGTEVFNLDSGMLHHSSSGAHPVNAAAE
jgi:hypothetical protein